MAESKSRTIEPRDDTGRSKAPRKPPKWLFKYVMNPLMKAILRSPFHGRISKALMLLTFRGRKSGKEYTTPVGYHRDGDDLLVFTHSPWWRNFQRPAPVTTHVQGKRRRGTAEAVTNKDRILKQLEPLIRKYGARQARRFGLSLDPGHEPTTEKLRQAIEEQGLVMIRIKPRKGSE